jgi:hypothetical protein
MITKFNDFLNEKNNILLAPNGKPSNLNKFQWNQVRTPEFIKWFGDWINNPEEASKVVDENGEPLVVYHGSKELFNEFNIEKQRIGWVGKGFYFTKNKIDAKTFGKKVFNVFLDIKNPFVFEGDKINDDGSVSFAEDVTGQIKTRYNKFEAGNGDYSLILKENGHDGVIWGDIITTFKPNQIKSATNNNGNFSKSNNINEDIQDEWFEQNPDFYLNKNIKVDKKIDKTEYVDEIYDIREKLKSINYYDITFTDEGGGNYSPVFKDNQLNKDIKWYNLIPNPFFESFDFEDKDIIYFGDYKKRFHIPRGIQKVLMGIGLGFKLYKAFLKYQGYFVSNTNSTPAVRKIYYSLLKDKDVYSIIDKDGTDEMDDTPKVLLIWKDYPQIEQLVKDVRKFELENNRNYKYDKNLIKYQ